MGLVTLAEHFHGVFFTQLTYLLETFSLKCVTAGITQLFAAFSPVAGTIANTAENARLNSQIPGYSFLPGNEMQAINLPDYHP